MSLLMRLLLAGQPSAIQSKMSLRRQRTLVPMVTGLGMSPLALSRHTCRLEMQRVSANSSAVIISGAA